MACALAGQQTPNGYYNLERMLKAAASHGAEIGCCGTCLDARGIRDDMLVEGAHRSSLEQLTDWTLWAEQTLVFLRHRGSAELLDRGLAAVDHE